MNSVFGKGKIWFSSLDLYPRQGQTLTCAVMGQGQSEAHILYLGLIDLFQISLKSWYTPLLFLAQAFFNFHSFEICVRKLVGFAHPLAVLAYSSEIFESAKINVTLM